MEHATNQPAHHDRPESTGEAADAIMADVRLRLAAIEVIDGRVVVPQMGPLRDVVAAHVARAAEVAPPAPIPVSAPVRTPAARVPPLVYAILALALLCGAMGVVSAVRMQAIQTQLSQLVQELQHRGVVDAPGSSRLSQVP